MSLAACNRGKRGELLESEISFRGVRKVRERVKVLEDAATIKMSRHVDSRLVQQQFDHIIRRGWPCLSVSTVVSFEGKSRRASVHSIASRAEMHKRPTDRWVQDRPFLRSLIESKRNKATARLFLSPISACISIVSDNGATISLLNEGSGCSLLETDVASGRHSTIKRKEISLSVRTLNACHFAGNYFSFTGTRWSGLFLIRFLSFLRNFLFLFLSFRWYNVGEFKLLCDPSWFRGKIPVTQNGRECSVNLESIVKL